MKTRQRIDVISGEMIEDPPVRPFAALLQELGNGATHSELSESLWELIQRVEDTGKPGSLTLTITVKPMDKTGAMGVKDEIKLKLPEFDRAVSIAWIDRNGNLSRNNPDQPELTGLRAVPEPESQPLREAK